MERRVVASRSENDIQVESARGPLVCLHALLSSVCDFCHLSQLDRAMERVLTIWLSTTLNPPPEVVPIKAAAFDDAMDLADFDDLPEAEDDNDAIRAVKAESAKAAMLAEKARKATEAKALKAAEAKRIADLAFNGVKIE
jgi:hypothetical protein